MHYTDYAASQSPMWWIVQIAISVFALVCMWRIFSKAGKPGWAAIIPFYNLWVEFEIICGRGTAALRLLIPFYNIYWAVKACIYLARAYGKSTAFGVGMFLVPIVFQAILAFGDSKYQGPQ